MPVRAECKNLTPLTSKRGALATDARGCSLWRYLLERPPPAQESRVRDPLHWHKVKRCYYSKVLHALHNSGACFLRMLSCYTRGFIQMCCFLFLLLLQGRSTTEEFLRSLTWASPVKWLLKVRPVVKRSRNNLLFLSLLSYRSARTSFGMAYSSDKIYKC